MILINRNLRFSGDVMETKTFKIDATLYLPFKEGDTVDSLLEKVVNLINSVPELNGQVYENSIEVREEYFL